MFKYVNPRCLQIIYPSTPMKALIWNMYLEYMHVLLSIYNTIKEKCHSTDVGRDK